MVSDNIPEPFVLSLLPALHPLASVTVMIKLFTELKFANKGEIVVALGMSTLEDPVASYSML